MCRYVHVDRPSSSRSAGQLGGLVMDVSESGATVTPFFDCENMRSMCHSSGFLFYTLVELSFFCVLVHDLKSVHALQGGLPDLPSPFMPFTLSAMFLLMIFISCA